MSEDQFTKLYNHMTKRFNELEAKIDAKADAEQVNKIYNIVDGISKRLDDDDQERTALVADVERQRGWMGQLAKNTNTKLSPEL